MKNCQKLQKFQQNHRKKSTRFKIIFQKNKKKTICSKAKFIKQLNVLAIFFFFQIRNIFYLTLDHRSLFVFNKIQLMKQSLLSNIRFIQIRFQFFALRFKLFLTRKI